MGNRLSLCMIARDEAHCLGRALQSALPWVDEVVLVDTGSRDGTVSLARHWGARVVIRPWEGDFSLHRNQALDLAGGDWILVLDADEELDQASAPLLRQALGGEQAQGFVLPVYSLMPGGYWSMKWVARLFRRSPGIRFQGRIHEQPTLPAPPDRLAGKILHYGYNLEPQARHAKAQQRIPLLRQWVAEEPDNYAARVHLANALLNLGGVPQAEEALKQARLALDLAGRQKLPGGLLTRCFWAIIMALRLLELRQELKAVLDFCQQLFPQWPDLVMAQIWWAEERQDWPLVCQLANRFLDLQEHWQDRPLEYPYSQNYFLGREAQAVFHWWRAAHCLANQEAMAQLEARLGKTPQGQAWLERARQRGAAQSPSPLG